MKSALADKLYVTQWAVDLTKLNASYYVLSKFNCKT